MSADMVLTNTHLQNIPPAGLDPEPAPSDVLADLAKRASLIADACEATEDELEAFADELRSKS